MEPKTWPCEHIKETGNIGPYENNFVYGKGNNIIMLHQSEMFCKFCGAKRPEKQNEKQKKLWKISMEAYYKTIEASDYIGTKFEEHKASANAVLDAVIKIANSISLLGNPGHRSALEYRTDLIKCLEELR